ncbi:hypothetical protein J6524_04890 [Bradyrhizobium sp. WSM 1738]|uniref:hypothetical protein n=1 Tax=Bradyrhizobium hereditatis TaxID=2821405 RepID=UPI001CE250F0|nr:hypothetical protein [Bradyrhizobium hereditatis]MCA6114265.1 hypothetical protein [Bradyrhizobium hereditatis]
MPEAEEMQEMPYSAGTENMTKREKRLEFALREILNAKEPPERPEPDDIDWRFVALEMKRLAELALGSH